MTTSGASKVVDKLQARGFIFGKMGDAERQARIDDLVTTYLPYNDTDVYDAYAEYLNKHRDAPQPCDILPGLRRKYATRNLVGLYSLTDSEIEEMQKLCLSHGFVKVSFLDYAVRGDGHTKKSGGSGCIVRGNYASFKATVECAIDQGLIY